MTLAEKKLYTTGTAGEFLGVAPKTVGLLMERGHLKGYRIPSTSIKEGGDRRIPFNSILEFLAQRGYEFELDSFENGKVDVVMPNGFLSSGKAAKILGVVTRTAVRYLENGILNGYTLPESPSGGECHKFCKISLINCLIKTGRMDYLTPEQLNELRGNSSQGNLKEAA